MASRIEQKQQARERRIAAEQQARRHDRRRAMLMRLGLVLSLAVVVVVVAIVASSNSGSNASTGGGGNDAGAARALFQGIPQDGIHLGDPNAKATLIEFADLQCPFCAQYSNAALATVVKRYVRPGTLRYELHIRSFLGDGSKPDDSKRAAAAAAVAAQDNRLYQFADVFYRRQKEENTGYVTDDFLRSIAGATGVDADRAVKAASNPGAEPMVAQAEQEASNVGSTSTPDFYLRLKGGRLVPVRPQALTGDAMVQAIDQALPASARSGT